MKTQLLRSAAIVGLAFVIAVVANAVAGRERKLVLPGYYPDPFRIPAGQRQPVATAAVTPVAPSAAAAVPAVQETATAVPVTAAVTTTTVATATVAPPPLAPAATAAAAKSPAPAATQPAPAPAPAPQPAQSLTERFPPHPEKAYAEISGPDAAWLHARGALFLDARRTSVYEQGHIAGARSFSVWESDVDEKVNGLFNERGNPEEQAQPIVIYCSGGACEDSHMLAQKLWGIEFNNILVYKDGFPDWLARKGPTRSAKK